MFAWLAIQAVQRLVPVGPTTIYCQDRPSERNLVRQVVSDSCVSYYRLESTKREPQSLLQKNAKWSFGKDAFEPFGKSYKPN